MHNPVIRLGAVALTVMVVAACQDQVVDPDLNQPDGVVLARDGGGGGGGGPAEPGPPDKKGDLYADLVFLLRDADGLPILKTFIVQAEEGTDTAVCVQPVSYEPIPELDTTEPVDIGTTTNEVNGEQVWLVPLYGDYMEPATVVEADGILAASTEEEEEAELAPCDPYGEFDDAGTLTVTYGIFAEEVPFGRLNLGRAPQRTVDRAYSEVLLKLSGATLIAMDHAGRWAPDYVAIDAPAEDLVIHREMVTRGQFADFVSPVPFGWTSQRYSFLDHAASALAGAADKFGWIGEDLVVYNNRILGFPEAVATGGLGTITGDGVHGAEGEKYLDYGDYTYTRSEMFPGCVVAGDWDSEGNPIRIQGTIMAMVFGNTDWTGENINAFATRADDARAVILYEHDFWIYAIDRIGETAVCGEYGIE